MTITPSLRPLFLLCSSIPSRSCLHATFTATSIKVGFSTHACIFQPCPPSFTAFNYCNVVGTVMIDEIASFIFSNQLLHVYFTLVQILIHLQFNLPFQNRNVQPRFLSFQLSLISTETVSFSSRYESIPPSILCHCFTQSFPPWIKTCMVSVGTENLSFRPIMMLHFGVIKHVGKARIFSKLFHDFKTTSFFIPFCHIQIWTNNHFSMVS